MMYKKPEPEMQVFWKCKTKQKINKMKIGDLLICFNLCLTKVIGKDFQCFTDQLLGQRKNKTKKLVNCPSNTTLNDSKMIRFIGIRSMSIHHRLLQDDKSLREFGTIS